MKGMFQDCHKLEYLNLSNFNTNNVTDMSYMFNYCVELKQINNNFYISKVITMYSMFKDCQKLEYLDLSHFNTSNV